MLLRQIYYDEPSCRFYYLTDFGSPVGVQEIHALSMVVSQATMARAQLNSPTVPPESEVFIQIHDLRETLEFVKRDTISLSARVTTTEHSLNGFNIEVDAKLAAARAVYNQILDAMKTVVDGMKSLKSYEEFKSFVDTLPEPPK